MAIKIYADVLFLTNFVFDYLLLIFTMAICKEKTNSKRLLLASSFGSFFATILFFNISNENFCYILQFFLLCGMIFIAYNKKSFLNIMKTSIVFYICAFVMGGIIMTFPGINVITSNGIAYLDAKTTELFIIAVVAYVISDLGFGIIGEKQRKNTFKKDIFIVHNEEEIKFTGFCDSGNFAKDSEGRGVIFARGKSARALLEKCDQKEKISIKTVTGKAELISFLPSGGVFYFKNKDKIFADCRIAIFEPEEKKDCELLLPNDFFANF